MKKKYIILIAVLAFVAITKFQGFKKETDQGLWKKVANVTEQAGLGSDALVMTKEHISISEAKAIAEKDPAITHFIYVKARELELKGSDGQSQLFHRHDALFFKGEASLSQAPKIADTYVKKN